MPLYVQSNAGMIGPGGNVVPVWEVDAAGARQINVSGSDLNVFPAAPGQTALETLQSNFPPGTTFEKLELGLGEYYPAMARPMLGGGGQRWANPDQSDEAVHRRASATGQLHALIQQLEHICRVVQPISKNFKTYGHEIRNVLILACTEVEAQWKAILQAHGVTADNTTKYVKLCQPMKLPEYSVEFPYYPWIAAKRPFENWQHGSRDLPWYDAYNKVKHNRDENFALASLDNAFAALSGFFVMLCAQYGSDFALSGEAASRAFFRLKATPQWSAAEFYVPANAGVGGIRRYPFAA